MGLVAFSLHSVKNEAADRQTIEKESFAVSDVHPVVLYNLLVYIDDIIRRIAACSPMTYNGYVT